MAKHPKLDFIVKKMESGNDFEVDRVLYLKVTGADIPQDKSYTEKRSAVAKRALEHGYAVKVIPERLVFTKIS